MSNNKPSPQARDQIDESLRRVFQEDTEAELPDRFKELLDQLRNQSEAPSDDGDAS
ncbi:MAG: NepR family anti-sigma factor [Pseudomonadota bacterium]